MEPSNHKTEAIFLKRIKYMMALRVILVSIFLGLPLLLDLKTTDNPWSITTFYVLIGTTYGLSLFYSIALKLNVPLIPFTAFQLGMDLILETVLISVTGGLGSPFPFLFMITIVAAAILFQHKGGVLLAGFSTILFGLLALLQRSQLPPFDSGIPLGDKDVLYGVFLYMIAFFTVGTLSGKLAKRLREEEIGFLDLRVFHEDIVHSMPSGLITTDLEGRITSFNRSASEITGYHSENVIGKTWGEQFSWSEIEERFDSLSKTGTPERFEGEIHYESGQTRLLGVTISALRNEQGIHTGFIGTFQDLTEIRNLEEAVQRKERLATIGEMAAGMAHEIRNPLASLSGSIQVLQNELELSGENIKLMEIAIKESERLNAFVTQFLRFARPLPPQREWVNLQTLLSETVLLLQNHPAYTHCVETVLEASDEPLLAFVDPDQMKQIFWNLGNNAYQAMQTGGILTLSAQQITQHMKEDSVEILFTDTGKGISKEDLPHIFEPFFTTKSAGSGLGLAIVQRVIEEHFGEISVNSRPGETRFKIRLPLSSTLVPPFVESLRPNNEFRIQSSGVSGEAREKISPQFITTEKS